MHHYALDLETCPGSGGFSLGRRDTSRLIGVGHLLLVDSHRCGGSRIVRYFNSQDASVVLKRFKGAQKSGPRDINSSPVWGSALKTLEIFRTVTIQ